MYCSQTEYVSIERNVITVLMKQTNSEQKKAAAAAESKKVKGKVSRSNVNARMHTHISAMRFECIESEQINYVATME